MNLAECSLKAVHPQRPLIGDEAPFDERQEPKRENEGQSGPDHRMEPNRCIWPKFLCKKHQASNDMADDEDGQIGRGVVGTMMEELLAAPWADIIDLEIGAEDPALTAGGTVAAPALADRLPGTAGGAGGFTQSFWKLPQIGKYL